MAQKIKVGDRELRAKFYHEYRDSGEKVKRVFDWEQAAATAVEEGQILPYDGSEGKEDLFNGFTVCDIVDGKEVLARGFAFCSSKDQFCRKRGREISLGRALKVLEHSEESINSQENDKASSYYIGGGGILD